MGSLRYKRRLLDSPGGRKKSPQRLDRALVVARASRLAESWDETEKHCRRILEARPDHTEALYLLAVALNSSGNQQESAELLARAISQEPAIAMLHSQLGSVLQAQGRHEEAIASFERATALDPKVPDHYNNLGNSLRAAGRLGEAVQCYRSALSFHENTALLMNLAITLYEQGNAQEALDTYRQLLSVQPEAAEALQNMAHILHEQGQLTEALDQYEKLLNLKPELVPAHLRLGIALQNQDHFEEAIRCYRKVLEFQPDSAAAYNNMGSALRLQEKYTEAIASLQKAIELEPCLAIAHNNLGVALGAEKRWDEALAALERAKALTPGDMEVYNNLGNLYSAQEKFALALECYAKAQEIQPESAEVDNNAGNVLRELGQLDRAEERYRRALRIKPDFADAWSNLGNALREQARFAEAIGAYTHAIELKPDNAGFRWNRSLVELASGDLEHGWAEYYWGFRCKQRQPVRDLPQPAWNGQNLTGKTVFVWGEQGVGDEIMFGNSIPDLARAADRCVIECDPRLMPLFGRSFPDCEFVPRTHPIQPRAGWPDIDLQVPMGNLAQWLRPTVASFPCGGGYLQADPVRVAHWKQRLAGLGPGLKVGISWKSQLMNAARRKLYVPLEQWQPILQTPGVQFVNLQYCDWASDIAETYRRSGVPVHHFQDLNLREDLDEVAALISALDLTITVNNICMTMGGALNAATWVFAIEGLMSWVCLGTDRAPWYPGVRLFYRTWRESWEPVVNAMAAELQRRTEARNQPM